MSPALCGHGLGFRHGGTGDRCPGESKFSRSWGWGRRVGCSLSWKRGGPGAEGGIGLAPAPHPRAACIQVFWSQGAADGSAHPSWPGTPGVGTFLSGCSPRSKGKKMSNPKPIIGRFKSPVCRSSCSWSRELG